MTRMLATAEPRFLPLLPLMSTNKNDDNHASNKWMQWIILAVVLMIFMMNLSTQGAGTRSQVVETKTVRTKPELETAVEVKDHAPPPNPPPTASPTASPTLPPAASPTLPPTLAPTHPPTMPPTLAVVPPPVEAPVETPQENPDISPPVAPVKEMTASQVEELSRKFQTAKDNLKRTLEEQYGSQYYQSMFVDTDAARQTFRSAGGQTNEGMGLSWQRLRQRVEYKVLQSLQDTSSTFLWATGGHSSTAGHGNFYDESYTAVLERLVTPLFAALGISFEGRNYAMGGTVSSPETAACFEEIFGADDIDVAVWDFGMTEAGYPEMMPYYCYRAAMSPNFPACFVYHISTFSVDERVEALAELEAQGMMAFYSDSDVQKKVEDAIPDSGGIELAEIEAIPSHIRNYKCGNKQEDGDPFCALEKYNETHCSDRKFKASWHQGWKWHALQGVHVALFLTEIIENALEELKTRGPTTEYMDSLMEMRRRDLQRLQSKVPSALDEFLKDVTNSDIKPDDVLIKPSFCHTGLLPAETRHKGILTDSPPGTWKEYAEGILLKDALSLSKEGQPPQLIMNTEDRQECEVQLNIDYKDYFLVKDEWSKITLPSDRELQEYGRGQDLLGLVALCLVTCPWGNCERHELREDHFRNQTAAVEVNGVSVTDVTIFDRCFFLRGEDGHYFPLNDKGRLEIRARSNEPDKRIRISSFLVW